jgi:SAM-dependent methyltransferase
MGSDINGLASYPCEHPNRKGYESTIYDEWYSREGKLVKPFFYHNERSETVFVRSLVKRFKIKPLCKLIDIGCGNGFYSHAFASNGLHITAIDISETAINFCKNRYGKNINWICGDIFDTAIDRVFDYGFCNFFTFFNAFDIPSQGTDYCHQIMRSIKPKGFLMFIWYSDLTSIRLPPHRFSIMNFTIRQLETLFQGYHASSYAIDSCGRIPLFLGRCSYNKLITRLSCSTVTLLSSSWKRVRIIMNVYKD